MNKKMNGRRGGEALECVCVCGVSRRERVLGCELMTRTEGEDLMRKIETR